MKRILLVDDDETTSSLLLKFIEAEGYAVAYGKNGKAGWLLYESFRPDLILLDVNMPELNGFELAEKIRATDRKTIIFFLTDRTEKADRLHGFNLKGNDYIPKPFYPEELMAKINERLDNETQGQGVVQLGDTLFDPLLSTLEYDGGTAKLSARQTEILSLLSSRRGQLVDRETILETVWGNASYANDLALNVQITYIRRALADPRITIVSLKKRGYVLTIS